MRGFTLVEIILVIIIMGIVSVMTSQFVIYGVELYRGSVERMQRVAQARFLLARLNRELGYAHVGSVQTDNGGLCLEFVPVYAVGAYRVNIVGQNTFNAIATPEFQADNSIDYSGQRLSVYSLFPSEFYLPDADLLNDAGTVALIDSYTLLGSSVRVSIALSGSRTLSQSSPGQRYFILNTPVRYCFENNQLLRYDNYGWVFSGGAGVLMMDRVQIDPATPTNASFFNVSTSNLFRAGMVAVNLHLQLRNQEEVRFYQRMTMNYVP